MLIFITPKALPRTQWSKCLSRKSRNLRAEPETDRRANPFQVVDLIKKQPANLVIVKTNKKCLRAPYEIVSLAWKSKAQAWIIKQREAIRSWSWSHIWKFCSIVSWAVKCFCIIDVKSFLPLTTWHTAKAQHSPRSVGCLSQECGLPVLSRIQTIMDQAWNQKEVSLLAGIKTGSHLSEEPRNQWFSNLKTQRSYL